MRTPWGWINERDRQLRAEWEARDLEAMERAARARAPGGGVPQLGTAEGRERLRQSGVPLDEWVVADFDTPAGKVRMAAEERRCARKERIVYWLLGLVILGAVIWTAATSDEPPINPDAYEWVEEDTPYVR